MSPWQACCWLPGLCWPAPDALPLAVGLHDAASPTAGRPGAAAAADTDTDHRHGRFSGHARVGRGPGMGTEAGDGRACWPASIAADWSRSTRVWRAAADHELDRAAPGCRAALAREGVAGTAAACALAFVATAIERELGVRPFEQQAAAAWHLLQGRLVEMATGEGKTLAAGLAAAVAAWANRPVHVLTANDYLVERDHAQLAPVFTRLGLRSATVVAGHTPVERRLAYRSDIVYVTGRELIFDHLKDHLSGEGVRDERQRRALALAAETSETGAAAGRAEPLIPRLGQALIDEADSILLDEAVIPFVLSMPAPAPDPAALAEARRLAAQLVPGEDFRLLPAHRQARLTAAGRDRVARGLPARGPLWPARLAHEYVCAALVARHLLQRGRDYAVTPQGLQLIDEVTGRIAVGRQWHGVLHALVELEEGLVHGPASHPAARLTFQRFFPRYEHLGGMSGTLAEARGELRSLYRCRVFRMPRVRLSQARWLGQRCYADASSRQAAVVQAVAQHRAQGRPVLVGTDSVQASQALSAALERAGIAHRVLNAVQDADEAASVAAAGHAGAVTVTTNMAGRGTDIRLDAAARAAGGLHVIVAQTNRSRRIDRQLAGRAARQGDPGSAEVMACLEDAVLRQGLPAALRRGLALQADEQGLLPHAPAALARGAAQHLAEWRERLMRRDLSLADARLDETYAFAGGTE